MGKKTITIAIVDDHALFREGLRNLLTEDEEVEVLFEAENGLDMQGKIQKFGVPELVLLDINMPKMDGYETAAWIKKEYPSLPILALSMYEDEASIIKMIRNGAGGYILKGSNTQEVLRGIKSIIQTGYFLNDSLSGKLIHSLQKEKETKNANMHLDLTEREKIFLQYCCSELTYKEMAEEMKVSVRTVDNYRESLFEKLKVKSRTGLVLFAIKNKIISL